VFIPGVSSGVAFLECKTPRGGQRDSQKEFEKLCQRCGIVYAVVRSKEEARRVVNEKREEGEKINEKRGGDVASTEGERCLGEKHAVNNTAEAC